MLSPVCNTLNIIMKKKLKSLKFDMLLLRLIMLLFKFMGVAPFNFNNLTIIRLNKKTTDLNLSRSRIGSIYNIFLALCLLLLIYFIMPLLYAEKSRSSVVAQPFRITVFIGSSLIVIIITLFYVLRQKQIVTIINQLIQLNNELTKKLFNTCKTQNDKFQQILIFMIFIIVIIFISVTEMPRNGKRKLSDLIVISELFIPCSMIQYTIILIYLTKQFKLLNNKFDLLVNPAVTLKYNYFHITAYQYNRIVREFNIISKAYRILYEITCKLSNFYSFPSLFVCIYSFIGLMYSSYSMTSYILPNGKSFPPFINIINDILWIIQPIFPIIVLTGSVNGLNAEVCIS